MATRSKVGKEEFTLNDLARMVQEGFSEMNQRFDKRFDGVDAELKDIKDRLFAIESEIIEIKKKLQSVIHRHEFEYLKERVEGLEKELANIKKRH